MVSIEKCVSTFPKFDRLCLNAGGLAPIAMHESSGVTQTMVINALGASCLVDGLLAANKVPANARIVYIGSEVTHTIVSFTGLMPNYMWFGENDLVWAISYV